MASRQEDLREAIMCWEELLRSIEDPSGASVDEAQPHPGCHAPPPKKVGADAGGEGDEEGEAAAAAPGPGLESGLLTNLAEAKLLMGDAADAEELLVRALNTTTADASNAAAAEAEAGSDWDEAAAAVAAAATNHARGRALAVLGRVKHKEGQAVTAEGLFRGALDEVGGFMRGVAFAAAAPSRSRPPTQPPRTTPQQCHRTPPPRHSLLVHGARILVSGGGAARGI